MEERLKAGYTMYFSYNRDGNIQGGCLKKTDRGMHPIELIGEEQNFIQAFPHIVKSLENNNILQMYSSKNGMTTIMLGHKTLEGPYGEQECLEDTIVTYSSSPICALMELNNNLDSRKEKPLEYKKAYRLYGSDKYQFYTKKFMKENLEG